MVRGRIVFKHRGQANKLFTPFALQALEARWPSRCLAIPLGPSRLWTLNSNRSGVGQILPHAPTGRSRQPHRSSPGLLRSLIVICSFNGITLHLKGLGSSSAIGAKDALHHVCANDGLVDSVPPLWVELRTTAIRTCEAYNGQREPSSGGHLATRELNGRWCLIGLANNPLSSGRWALQRRLGKARLLDGNSAAPTQLAQQNTELLPLVGCCFGQSAESTERTFTVLSQFKLGGSPPTESSRGVRSSRQSKRVVCVAC
jgi:hypothetical protein